MSAQRYLPPAWAADPVRRHQAQVPAEETGATKLDRALGLGDRARPWGGPCAVGVADAGDGDQPAFLQGLEDRQLPSVCGVESTFGVRLPEEVRLAGRRRGRGRPAPPRPAPLDRAETLLARLPEEAGQVVTWREGSKGALAKQVVARRVHRATGGAHLPITDARVTTGLEGGLLGERPRPSETGEPQGYLSSRPADTPLPRLVELAHARGAIEPFSEDAKGECGLDDDQGRRGDGLPRHLARVLRASRFLVAQARPPPDPTDAAAAGFPPPPAGR